MLDYRIIKVQLHKQCISVEDYRSIHTSPPQEGETGSLDRRSSQYLIACPVAMFGDMGALQYFVSILACTRIYYPWGLWRPHLFFQFHTFQIQRLECFALGESLNEELFRNMTLFNGGTCRTQQVMNYNE